jgi:hypothetical protein
MKYALLFVQAMLSHIFLFDVDMKFIMPPEVLTAASPLPLLFVRFIGICEVLGALGLILPGLLRIQPVLTPLAAAGLVIIMAGATTITLAIGGGITALIPLVIGLLAAFVVYGRMRLVPLAGSSPAALQPAC